MPRDNDKNNASPRGRRDRQTGGKGRSADKGRSGAKRGPEKKFAKRAAGGKPEGERRAYAGKSEGGKSFGGKSFGDKPFSKKPYAGKRDGDAPRRSYGDGPRRERDDARPARFNRDERPARSGDRPERGPRKDFRPRDDRGGEKRPYTPRGERGDARPAGRFGDKKFGDKTSGEKRPYTPRGEGFRKDGPRKDFGSRDGERKFDRPRDGGFRRDDDRPKFSRGPRKEFGEGRDRSNEKPWENRERRDSRGRDDARKFDKPRFDRSRDDRGGEERPRFSRSRDEGAGRGARSFDKPKFDRPRGDRPKFDRPREGREDRGDRPTFRRLREDRDNGWQEHPRSEGRSERFSDRPRRDNEDDSKVFAKRPAFGGRGAYRERKLDPNKRISRPEPAPKKAGERIAKLMSRRGLASRRDAEEWVTQGRVTVNGRVINSPALDVTENDVVTVDGKPLPERERTRLFLYHKPRGLMTTHSDPEGRPTVFEHLPDGLPRLISVGRLDFNTEGLLLLTNDGGLARVLELPDTGWLRRYRARAHGEVTQAQLDALRDGLEVDGVKYGSVEATLEHDQGSNVWITIAIREGKNREVRNILGALGLEVNRLIRISYGPFQLGEIEEGQVDEVKTRVLREQLGDKVAQKAGAEFARTVEEDAGPKLGRDGTPLRSKKANKLRPKTSKIEDRKGRTVKVQRTGSDEARAHNEAIARGHQQRPKRGYHGKRDFTPRDE
ncbi:MAG: pseudouridine synthase [Rhizobiales bacterium]|nr:pseudouridine synthase [Hyphomicrobiales bacterium]